MARTTWEVAAEIKAARRARAKIGDVCITENRALTDAERSRFMAAGAKIDDLEHELEALDPNEAAAHRAIAGMGSDPHGTPLDGAPVLARPKGRRFADLFGAAAGSLDGWRDGGEFLGVVGRGLHDARLRADSQSGESGSAGGFAVPSQLWGAWLDQSLETEIVRPRCITWPMTTSELGVPALDDLDRSGGDVGGLTLQFAPELGTLTPQVAKLRLVALKARKGYLFVEASNELLADAPNFEANLSAALIKVLGFGLDKHFLFGDGAAGPLGALVSGAQVVVPRTTAGKILYEDALGMFARLTPASVARAVWIAHPSTIPQLGTLSVAVGTGGSFIPAMTESGGQFRLLTLPVIFSEKVAALGTQADLALCDFGGGYAIGLRKDAAIDKSMHVGFAKDVETYRLTVRVDGQPTVSKPITPLTGPTMSPFVVLGDPL